MYLSTNVVLSVQIEMQLSMCGMSNESMTDDGLCCSCPLLARAFVRSLFVGRCSFDRRNCVVLLLMCCCCAVLLLCCCWFVVAAAGLLC